MTRSTRTHGLRYLPLTHRVVKEPAILAGALVVMGLLNLALMRRALSPVERLRDFVREVDSMWPGQHAEVPGRESEAAELALWTR